MGSRRDVAESTLQSKLNDNFAIAYKKRWNFHYHPRTRGRCRRRCLRCFFCVALAVHFLCIEQWHLYFSLRNLLISLECIHDITACYGMAQHWINSIQSGRTHDIRHAWHQFDAGVPHCTMSFEVHGMSVVLYKRFIVSIAAVRINSLHFLHIQENARIRCRQYVCSWL